MISFEICTIFQAHSWSCAFPQSQTVYHTPPLMLLMPPVLDHVSLSLLLHVPGSPSPRPCITLPPYSMARGPPVLDHVSATSPSTPCSWCPSRTAQHAGSCRPYILFLYHSSSRYSRPLSPVTPNIPLILPLLPSPSLLSPISPYTPPRPLLYYPPSQ